MSVSPNEAVVRSLTSALQSKDKDLHQLLSKIDDDLYTVYQTLFAGPLPTNDGSALTNLNAAELTGVFPSPMEVQGEDPLAVIHIAAIGSSGGGTRIGTLPSFGTSLFSNNLYWNGSGWVVEGNGSMVYQSGGGIYFYNHLGGGLLPQGAFVPNGGLVIGVSAATWSSIGDISIPNQAQIWGCAPGNASAYRMILINGNNVIRMGLDASNGGIAGHISIPDRSIMPGAGAAADGLIVIDKANNRFCFYTNSSRFYVNGTAF